MAHDFITVVSGLPRSGTSLMMQMLHAGGLPTLSDGLRTADANNPRGYFEFDPVKRLRSDNGWLPQARGHAVKIIHLLLRELRLDGSLQYRIVFMQRPMAEVLASQRAMLLRDGKASADASVLKQAFEKQLEQIDTWLAEQAHVVVMQVPYHQVMCEPLATAVAVNTFLGLTLDTAAMVRAVDPALHRQHGPAAGAR